MFAYQANTTQGQKAQILSPVVDRLYAVTSSNFSTMIIEDGLIIERLFRDCIGHSPITASGTSGTLNDACHYTSNSNARTTSGQNSPQPGTSDAIPEFVFDRIIDSGIADSQSPLFCVYWYGYRPKDGT